MVGFFFGHIATVIINHHILGTNNLLGPTAVKPVGSHYEVCETEACYTFLSYMLRVQP